MLHIHTETAAPLCDTAVLMCYRLNMKILGFAKGVGLIVAVWAEV